MGWWPKFQIVSSESVQRALLSHFGYRGECHTDQRPLVVLRCSCRRQMTRPLPPPRRTEWWVLGGLWMHHKDIQKHRHAVRWILRTSDMLLWLQEHGLIGIDVNVTECKKNKQCELQDKETSQSLGTVKNETNCIVDQNLLVLFFIISSIFALLDEKQHQNMTEPPPALVMAVDTHCCTSLLTCSTHTHKKKFDPNIQIWIHPPIISIVTDF